MAAHPALGGAVAGAAAAASPEHSCLSRSGALASQS
eukprot:COSAG01_NODE_12272_length_1769_cov_1.501198_2_plen_36_part_00